MTISAFIQDNIAFVAGAVGLGLYLIYFEIKNLSSSKTRVSTAQLTRLINDGATIIDLRKAEDFRESHISDAINIPLETLESKISNLNKSKPVAVYCYQGISSNKAVKQLQKAGFDVKQLTGGFAGWIKNSLPVNSK